MMGERHNWLFLGLAFLFCSMGDSALTLWVGGGVPLGFCTAMVGLGCKYR